MNILADFHHQALYKSLQLLFEERLGHTLYRPIGMEWYKEGYWNVFPHPGTAQQYLSLDQAKKVPRGMEGKPFRKNELPNLLLTDEGDGIYLVDDKGFASTYKAITLPKFQEMKFGIVVSSIPAHIGPFNRLIQECQPGCKHIFQIGNAWGHQGGVNNVLASTAGFHLPHNTKVCYYHQEFDQELFKYTPPTTSTAINSYIHYMKAPELFRQVMKFLPGWESNRYGAGMDRALAGAVEVAPEIIKSGWTWHYKPEGDGYGHTLFSSYACGRPAVIARHFYTSKLGNELLEDDVTCINIDGLSARQVADKLLYWSEPTRHATMCAAAYKRFCDVVDFGKEGEKIERFVRNLI